MMTKRDTLTYDPCPDCGEQNFRQESLQVEDIEIDDDGELAEIVPQDTVDIQILWCKTCDDVIWESNN